MIVFGGRSDEYGTLHTNHELYDNSVYMFDIENFHWTKVVSGQDFPVGRRSHNACECLPMPSYGHKMATDVVNEMR